MGYKHLVGVEDGEVGRNKVFVAINNLHCFRKQLTVPVKAHIVRLEKEHPPLVVIRYINLFWAYILEQRKVLQSFSYPIKLSAY
tara:strand:+ start:6833 stop:7084 length:252 start_codon:yes stop_codon:yes gene_type:complete